MIVNFETHSAEIEKQMAEEQKSLENEDGELLIAVENRNLEEKYQELLKEVKEKSESMKLNI